MTEKKPITDGVYGFVSGTVTRRFSTRNGDAIEVEVKGKDRDGNEQRYGDKWTVWGDLDVPEGARVTVKGWLSARAETFEKAGETKAACRRSVNRPELVEVEDSVPPAEEWGGPDYGDTTPF